MTRLGGVAPGGGGGTPTLGKGGPPRDKSDDGSDEEEDDESDTDKEGRGEEKITKGELEACLMTQMIPLEKEVKRDGQLGP